MEAESVPTFFVWRTHSMDLHRKVDMTHSNLTTAIALCHVRSMQDRPHVSFKLKNILL